MKRVGSLYRYEASGEREELTSEEKREKKHKREKRI
jgi:hypothetical protein